MRRYKAHQVHIVMNLNTVLHNVIRPKIPESVFVPCLAPDRQLVENILLVAQELNPTLDVTQSVLTKNGTSYIVFIPSSSPSDMVSLSELRDIQNYAPGRISDIHVLYRNDTLTLKVSIRDETSPMTCTQLDIIRVSKRKRV